MDGLFISWEIRKMDDLGAAILGHIQIYNDTPGVLEGSPAEYKANMR